MTILIMEVIYLLVKYHKKIDKYFSKHVQFNSTIHALGGLGVGILVATTVSGIDPLWGIVLVMISLLGHVYAWNS